VVVSGGKTNLREVTGSEESTAQCDATLALAFLLVVGVVMGYTPRILAVRIVFAVLVGVVLAAAFWSVFESPCPNCWKSMGSTGFWVSVGRTGKVPERCPHCDIGVDIDVPNRETKK
jgi:hypothetical protein